MSYIDEEEVIDDVKRILAMPPLDSILFHSIEEIKMKYLHEMELYKELEKNIEQQGNKNKKLKNPVEKVDFELKKIKNKWTVKPGNQISVEVINHIISMDIYPGEMHMGKYKLEDGRRIELAVSKHSDNHYTGSIKVKINEKHEKKYIEIQREEPKKTVISTKRKQEITSILKNLLTNENFFEFVYDLLKHKCRYYKDEPNINGGNKSSISG